MSILFSVGCINSRVSNDVCIYCLCLLHVDEEGEARGVAAGRIFGRENSVEVVVTNAKSISSLGITDAVLFHQVYSFPFPMKRRMSS